MNNYILIFAVLLIIGCKTDTPKVSEKTSQIEEVKIDPASFDWLLGKWKRMNDKGNKVTFEEWVKESNTSYLGKGYVMENDKNVWQENIKLIQEEQKWRLEVQLSSESSPTVFNVTKFDKSSFVCKNPENEFPKSIKYFKDGQRLKAEIKGGDMMVLYEFMQI